MAQRAALVRGLALRPRALLLDEPFSAVDPLLREEIFGPVLTAFVYPDTPTPSNPACGLAGRWGGGGGSGG
jgi:ABC-type uncharacterized transport system YnjBCD ATPase subunit